MLSPRVRLEWPGKSVNPEPTASNLELARRGHPSCMLVEGDNVSAMRALADRSEEGFALAYLDPPFFTGRQHARVNRSRDARTGKIVRSVSPAFDDRWNSLSEYLDALKARIEGAWALLASHGCLVLHVDPKTSHYAKVLCDEIFGPECFASEIVWRYRRWPSKTKNFQRVHDVLLRYVKDPDGDTRFRQLYEPLAASTVATWGRNKQRAVVGGDGRRTRSSTTDEESRGTPMGDVWEIGIVAPVARERTGYPTQKPEALIERLIEACTDPGDLVIDPYAGSGTTLAVCARKGRRVVGVDESSQALRVTRKRLRAQGVRPLEERVVAVPKPGLRRTGSRRQQEAQAS